MCIAMKDLSAATEGLKPVRGLKVTELEQPSS